MKYKIVSLIMIIPIILMLCVFSAANLVSITVPIPVSGISVYNNIEEQVNLASINNTLQINASVVPTNASNKGLTYTTEEVSGKKMARVQIDENGTITPLEVGTIRIIVTTKDSAYSSSFVLEIGSTLATDLEISTPIERIEVGDTFTFNGEVYPSLVTSGDISWSSSNNNILRVNAYTGNAEALSTGNVTITGVLADGINGPITRTLEVTVFPVATDSGILFNGQNSLALKTMSNSVECVMYIGVSDQIDSETTVTANDIVWEYDDSQVSSIDTTLIETINGGESSYNVTFTLQPDYTGLININAHINISGPNEYSSAVIINKLGSIEGITAELIGIKEFIKLNSTNTFSLELDPEITEGLSVDLNYDTDIISMINSGNIYQITGKSVGESELTFQINVYDSTLTTITKNISILNPYTTINFKDSATTYGISNELAIGNQRVSNDTYVIDRYQFEFTNETIDSSLLEWTNSNPSICSISDTGLLTINGNGLTTITATDKASILLNKPISTTVTIRCVTGVNVSTYAELMKATKANKQVIIRKSIDLGEKLVQVNDDGSTTLLKSASECSRILTSELTNMATTGEWNYYKYAEDYDTPPTIYYAIKFTNNVYGNGYTLNANNITNVVDGTGSLFSWSKFRGPIDLVKVKSADGIDSASVKAQDNIAFLIDDNVRIDNIELVGATLTGSTNVDLNHLNYVGTTVEVIGNNVQIVNSKIRNGRNVLRIFGAEDDKTRKINVTVASCILSYAREFVVKIGTNCIIKGEFAERDDYNLSQGIPEDSQIWQDLAPTIGNYTALNTVSNTSTLTEQYLNDANYQALVKTELTMRDCVISTSGLFSIGLEATFAGPALDGGKWNSWDFYQQGWRQIAGTSYPTRLNLHNVKIYDWKELSKVDSSTLMDGNMFSFDMGAMIEQIQDRQDVQEIITNIDGIDYVHGGIAMYGGGKNYSIIDFSEFDLEPLSEYSISLGEIGTSFTTMMSYASGKEPFKFFMYNKNTNFNYRQQLLDFSNGTVYDSIGEYIY